MREPSEEELMHGDRRKGVVLSKRIPEEFIQTTLLPHLEERMRMSIHVYSPGQLTQVARSYAKYTMDREDRGAGPLVDKLVETIKYRMPGFEAIDIVDILPASLQLRPDDDELFGMLGDRMKEKIDDFNALNLVGVVRAYLKRGDVEIVKTLLLPRLIESLKTYDPVEIAEILIAIGRASSTDMSLSGDVHILQCLLPELERAFSSLPLVVQLNSLWALAKLNVNHSGMRSELVGRFKDAKIVASLPTKIVAKAVWVFGRIGAFSDAGLVESILPVVRASRALFTPSEFSRLVMGLSGVPEGKADLLAIADRLLESLDCEEERAREPGTSTRKSRQEVMMILGGVERLGRLAAEPAWRFIEKEASKFEPGEIEHLVGLFYDQPEVLDSKFPKSWKEQVDSSKIRIAQIAHM